MLLLCTIHLFVETHSYQASTCALASDKPLNATTAEHHGNQQTWLVSYIRRTRCIYKEQEWRKNSSSAESWHSILKVHDLLRQNQAERGPWLQAQARRDFSQGLNPPHDFQIRKTSLSTECWIQSNDILQFDSHRGKGLKRTL